MTNRTNETSPMVRARIAGFLYLLANLPAPFALLYLPARFIVVGDAGATANNIMASESLFRLGFVSLLSYPIGNIFLVLALYQLLKVVNKNVAALMVIFSLVGISIAMFNELNSIAVLQILGKAEYLKVFPTEQLHALAYFFMRLHTQGLNIAQIFWGLWLLPMGVLVFKSGFLPRILGMLLVVGCFGYVVQSFAAFLGYNLSIIFFTSWGELALLAWLLIKGVNAEQWKKRAAESA